MLARERLLVAVLSLPHLQAHLHGLLQDLEALSERRVRETHALRFLRVVARADAQQHPPT
jgi:hypothetical protein